MVSVIWISTSSLHLLGQLGPLLRTTAAGRCQEMPGAGCSRSSSSKQHHMRHCRFNRGMRLRRPWLLLMPPAVSQRSSVLSSALACFCPRRTSTSSSRTDRVWLQSWGFRKASLREGSIPIVPERVHAWSPGRCLVDIRCAKNKRYTNEDITSSKQKDLLCYGLERATHRILKGLFLGWQTGQTV